MPCSSIRLMRRQQGLEDRPTFSAISATERAASRWMRSRILASIASRSVVISCALLDFFIRLLRAPYSMTQQRATNSRYIEQLFVRTHIGVGDTRQRGPV